MDWFLDFKLYETANLYCPIPVSMAVRRARAIRAVVARGYSDGHLILLVDFKGGYHVKALPKPAEND